jgi:hypothetical protein
MSVSSDKVGIPRLLILAPLLAICATGCGDNRAEVFPVQGKVIFPDGKPVRQGTVELLSMDHRINAAGTIRDDGTFVLGTYTDSDGACAGKHKVIVTQLIIADRKIRHQVDHGSPVDPSFGSYSHTPLTVEIRPQELNQIELVVERLKSRP